MQLLQQGQRKDVLAELRRHKLLLVSMAFVGSMSCEEQDHKCDTAYCGSFKTFY